MNIEDLCKDGTYFDAFLKKNFLKLFAFEHYRILVTDEVVPDLTTSLSNGTLCVNYVRKYVSLVTVESPTKSITKVGLE